MQQYIQDYDEKFPMFVTGTPTQGEPWWVCVQPYIKNEQVYVCPSSTPNGATTYWGRYYPPISYGYNHIIQYAAGGLKLGSVARPAEIVVLADSCHAMGDVWRFAWPKAPGAWNTTPSKCTNATTNRAESYTPHNGGSNYGFVDGHSKWMQATSFYGQAASMYTNVTN